MESDILIPEVEYILQGIIASKQRNKAGIGRRKTMFTQIYRRFEKYADHKIGYLNAILKSKKKNPDFVPDLYRLEENTSPLFEDVIKVLKGLNL